MDETSKNYILLKKYDYKLWQDCILTASAIALNASKGNYNLDLASTIEKSIISLLVNHLKEKNIIKDFQYEYEYDI